jgi:drug/metabolite transporter (DMT)-like permease
VSGEANAHVSAQPSVTRQENLRASLWLVADMSLNIWALSIVKAMGLDYSAAQLVFLRASVGLLLVLPWAYRERSAFLSLDRLLLHALRVALSAATLACSFFAIARVPFALMSAIGFTRPILLMVLAAWMLREHIARPRWIAALIGLSGALVALNPGQTAFSWGLVATIATVLGGTLAIIITRRLKGAPAMIMMVFYTAGLALFTAPFAWANWTIVEADHWPLLVAVGVFAQCAQFCFLKAHWLGEAGVLGPVSYLSLILSTGAGFFFFGEVPGLSLIIGAAIILGAAWYIGRSA